MIVVRINSRFYEEKCYAISMLLGDFLGLAYEIEIDSSITAVVIKLLNNKIIVIQDHFFSTILTNDYLFKDNIPTNVSSTTIINLDGVALLSLYGPASVKITDDEIIIESDIIASTFFMLSRWEEAVIKERDMNGRFPAKESLAVKHHFLDRPIVNEYVEVLWKAISRLDANASRKATKFNFLLTHDVDLPRLWWSWMDFVKSIGGALIKRKSSKEAISLTKQYFTKNDPFNVFDWMMSLSEKYGFISNFFFMSGGTSSKDNYYKIEHPVIIDLIKKIIERGHKIGFHPSFNAYNDIAQFTKERKLLEDVTETSMTTGRHHFLRFENPTTWQIWEDVGMHWDSTMSYHDKEGFRCGVCYPFAVFNILSKKKLSLVERPLTVMEGSFITYQKELSSDEMLERIKKLVDTTRMYNGEFVLLWHNSAFVNKDHRTVYEEVLKYASQR